MKHYLVALIGCAIVVIGTLAILEYRSVNEPIACTMDAMQCPDGSYVGRSGPNCSFAPCPPVAEGDAPAEPIQVSTPQPGAVVTNPITVSGVARGQWFFEASAPVYVTNWNGLIIGEGFITATGDWMTTDFVPFTGTITYAFDPETPYNRGALIFKKDNPSGLPEHDDAREIPIIFSEFITVDPPITAPPDEGVMCTMDAMLCPDGSYVGRVPPSCAFAPCP